ncbi:MAG: CPBP family intramembrane metalloprotease [Oscillospiraceae bacterium]|nr:CPBP family intramembrane metalloprotease [Oscillospiraceae bacterium]
MNHESNSENTNGKLLAVTALSLIGVYITRFFLAVLLYSSFKGAGENYILMWAVNDIIAYVPWLVILGAALSRYVPSADFFPAPRFKRGLVFPIFISMYALITAALLISHAIADLFTEMFGTDGLRNVFENIAPESLSQWLIFLFFAGIVAPLAEEIIFRHILLKPLRKLGDRPAIIITAVLFGVFHGNLTQFLYAAVAGVILGITAVKANSVKPAILLHMLNNSFDIGKSYLFELTRQGLIPVSEPTLNISVLLLFLAGIITAIVLTIKGEFTV